MRRSGNRGRGVATCCVLGLCMVLLVGACTSSGRARPPILALAHIS
jgi:hypothetical protein